MYRYEETCLSVARISIGLLLLLIDYAWQNRTEQNKALPSPPLPPAKWRQKIDRRQHRVLSSKQNRNFTVKK